MAEVREFFGSLRAGNNGEWCHSTERHLSTSANSSLLATSSHSLEEQPAKLAVTSTCLKSSLKQKVKPKKSKQGKVIKINHMSFYIKLISEFFEASIYTLAAVYRSLSICVYAELNFWFFFFFCKTWYLWTLSRLDSHGCFHQAVCSGNLQGGNRLIISVKSFRNKSLMNFVTFELMVFLKKKKKVNVRISFP